MERLELSQHKLLEPKPSASTNSATSVIFYIEEIVYYPFTNKSLKKF